MKKNELLLALFLVGAFATNAQELKSIKPKKPIICYVDAENKHTFIPPPEAFKKTRTNARTNAAVFEVTYVGFDPQSMAAFQHAVDIWESLIESPVKIKVKAYWRPLGSTVLGSATWATAFANFANAPKLNTFYPVAMAEKIAGTDLNHPDSTDIIANFSSQTNWYTGINGATPSSQYDLVSVVLHELGHGLGFTDSYTVSGGQGTVGVQGSVPIIYDVWLENNGGENLFQTFTSPSAALATQLTSNNVYFNSPSLIPFGGRARVYAPTPYNGGSSIAHLNESTYTSGNANSLMTPQIGMAEAMHDPGPITLNMFGDMGWIIARQRHTPRNLESTAAPYEALVVITSDQGHQANNVKLTYAKKSNGIDQTITGVATGNPNEFKFTIPAVGSADSLLYFLSVTDNDGRVYTNPGKFVKPASQARFIIGVGPDVSAPLITHEAKPFILASATSLDVEAVVSDNIGLEDVVLEYFINGNAQTPIPMSLVAGTEAFVSGSRTVYEATFSADITFDPGDIDDGDVLTYRIRATDNSSNENEKLSALFSLNVVGLSPTQDFYTNNFDAPSTDFFGSTQYSITTPSGFTNGAIHTVHPYPNGTGAGNVSNYVYQLRVPIRVKSSDAVIKFDEIVLVEPGDPGSVFGDDDFFDYVVVEGSKDGGINWIPIASGYDARDNTAWLTKYNSSSDGANPPNSTGVGDPTLYKPRVINILSSGNFAAGDEITIRFRLYADELVHGWGWAIDNLRIQVDETAPVILHDHYDYVLTDQDPLVLTVRATDGSGLQSLAIEMKVNANGAVDTHDFPVTAGVDEYSLEVDIEALNPGDILFYRIIAVDDIGNQGTLPAQDFLRVPYIAVGAPVTQYISTFNTANTDFVGNFFSIAQPSGFNSGAIHSTHPYPVGFGLLNNKSNFTYTLTKPITVSATNPYVAFDEVVLVEFDVNTVKDLVIVEGSKDNGATWHGLVNAYASHVNANWKSAFLVSAAGTSGLLKPRLIDLTASGDFNAGDQILIRFRFQSDVAVNGWGWTIDNLSIQGPVTGIEETASASIDVYPNPIHSGNLIIELPAGDKAATVQILNLLGSQVMTESRQLQTTPAKLEYGVDNLTSGLYFVRIDLGDGVWTTRKFIKSE